MRKYDLRRSKEELVAKNKTVKFISSRIKKGEGHVKENVTLKLR